MEERRSTWQVWHVHAEAQRQVRAAPAPAGPGRAGSSTCWSPRCSGTGRCRLARPDDGIIEPAALRRPDGTSVYTVAGSDLFTSTRSSPPSSGSSPPPAATTAAQYRPAAVDVALLEMTANGVTLNAGQAALVRQMATSGARLQLAIAPAGTGKTTAMQALAAAWTEAGGKVVGLAPSAAAAAQLRDQIDTHTDTLAKLTWSIRPPRPARLGATGSGRRRWW